MTQPTLDAFASSTAGVDLEDLSAIAAAQHYATAGPRVPRASLDALATAVGVPVEDGALREAGLIDEHGLATADGRSVIAPFRVRRAVLRVDRDDTCLEAWVGDRRALIASGEPDGQVQLDLVGATVLPLRLANWLEFAPAWAFGVACTVPRVVFESRLRDPSVGAPAGADAVLAQVWREPWSRWSLRVEPGGHGLSVVSVGARGLLGVSPSGLQDVELRSLPTAQAWRTILDLLAGALAG